MGSKHTRIIFPVEILAGPYCSDGEDKCPYFQIPEGVGECRLFHKRVRRDPETGKYLTPAICRQQEKGTYKIIEEIKINKIQEGDDLTWTLDSEHRAG